MRVESAPRKFYQRPIRNNPLSSQPKLKRLKIVNDASPQGDHCGGKASFTGRRRRGSFVVITDRQRLSFYS